MSRHLCVPCFNSLLFAASLRAGYRGAMHQAPQREVIVADGAMLNQAVVPDQQIPLPPVVRVERLAAYDMCEQAS